MRRHAADAMGRAFVRVLVASAAWLVFPAHAGGSKWENPSQRNAPGDAGRAGLGAQRTGPTNSQSTTGRGGTANPAGPADAGPAIAVDVSCEPIAGPGKLRCTVHERAGGGVWRWGDVIVVQAPPFAPPLRTRAGAADLVRQDASGAEFALALAATADGSGTLRVRGRAVICGSAGCRPASAEAEARVVVGGAP